MARYPIACTTGKRARVESIPPASSPSSPARSWRSPTLSATTLLMHDVSVDSPAPGYRTLGCGPGPSSPAAAGLPAKSPMACSPRRLGSAAADCAPPRRRASPPVDVAASSLLLASADRASPSTARTIDLTAAAGPAAPTVVLTLGATPVCECSCDGCVLKVFDASLLDRLFPAARTRGILSSLASTDAMEWSVVVTSEVGAWLQAAGGEFVWAAPPPRSPVSSPCGGGARARTLPAPALPSLCAESCSVAESPLRAMLRHEEAQAAVAAAALAPERGRGTRESTSTVADEEWGRLVSRDSWDTSSDNDSDGEADKPAGAVVAEPAKPHPLMSPLNGSAYRAFALPGSPDSPPDRLWSPDPPTAQQGSAAQRDREDEFGWFVELEIDG